MIAHDRICHIRELFRTNAAGGIYGVSQEELMEILETYADAMKPTAVPSPAPEAQSQEETEAPAPEPTQSARAGRAARKSGR
jgi:hypothetical protein